MNLFIYSLIILVGFCFLIKNILNQKKNSLKNTTLPWKRILVSSFYFILFAITFFFSFGFFYEFFFENTKNLLSIKSVKLLDKENNYFDINVNLNHDKVAFYFNQQENLLMAKNLDKNNSYPYDLREEDGSNPPVDLEYFFLYSTPYVDLDYQSEKINLRSLVVRDERNELQTKVEVRENEVKKTNEEEKIIPYIFPESGSYHSYTFSRDKLFFSQKKNKADKFIKLYFNEKNNEVALPLELVGHDYYPYYWIKKNILYFINVSIGQIEGKDTYLYNLVHYDFLNEVVLFNTFLGGDEELNLRSVKMSGDNLGRYFAYGTFDKDNTLYFFYYPKDNLLTSKAPPTHFFLKFDDLKNIYSFVFLASKDSETVSLLMVAQPDSGLASSSVGPTTPATSEEHKADELNRSVYEANLEVRPVQTIHLDYIFVVFLFLLGLGIVFLYLAFLVLKLRKK